MSDNKKKSLFSRASAKTKILLISVILILCISVGTTFAWLIATAGPIENIFDPSEVSVYISETLVNDVKSNVKVKNTGETDAYVRAYVSVTWQDANGVVCGQMPVEGVDYTISYDLANGWKLSSDGFYYWTSSVAPNAESGVLITSCAPIADRAPDGYKLAVEIVASGIQSDPASVVLDKWKTGVSAADGESLTVKE